MDQQKELQGLLFPQVLALQGSLNSRMEFSTPSSDHLARAPCHLSLDGSWFSFYSKMILPHTQAALRLPIFALGFLVGRAEGSCSWGLARKLAAESLHWDETTSLLPHDLVDGMGPDLCLCGHGNHTCNLKCSTWGIFLRVKGSSSQMEYWTLGPSQESYDVE